MDKQRMEGGLKKATGTIKEKAEGHLRSGIGHAKDAVREIVGENKK